MLHLVWQKYQVCFLLQLSIKIKNTEISHCCVFCLFPAPLSVLLPQTARCHFWCCCSWAETSSRNVFAPSKLCGPLPPQLSIWIYCIMFSCWLLEQTISEMNRLEGPLKKCVFASFWPTCTRLKSEYLRWHQAVNIHKCDTITQQHSLSPRVRFIKYNISGDVNVSFLHKQ